jgi:glutamine cyclotransferase
MRLLPAHTSPVGLPAGLLARALAVPLAVLLAACGSTADEAASAPGAGGPTDDQPTPSPGAQVLDQADAAALAAVPAGRVLRAVEVGRRPHDASAFTQGLEFDDGRLYESRGLFADDEPVVMTEIDPADGRPLRTVERPAGDPHFYEGLTVVDDEIIQLTWQDGVAYTYDLETFERTGELAYEGEGWGICDEPDRLLMTDGTPTLTHRDPETFEVLREVTVLLDGQPVDELNEVECVGGLVLANVWQTDRIVVIDPDSGEVVSQIDASAFADERGRYVEGGADVLNGIAFDPGTGTWLLTGKLWPWMFEVELECVEGCPAQVTPTHYRRG